MSARNKSTLNYVMLSKAFTLLDASKTIDLLFNTDTHKIGFICCCICIISIQPKNLCTTFSG